MSENHRETFVKPSNVVAALYNINVYAYTLNHSQCWASCNTIHLSHIQNHFSSHSINLRITVGADWIVLKLINITFFFFTPWLGHYCPFRLHRFLQHFLGSSSFFFPHLNCKLMLHLKISLLPFAEKIFFLLLSMLYYLVCIDSIFDYLLIPYFVLVYVLLNNYWQCFFFRLYFV